jgi:L-asparagine oxygenase
MFRRQNVLSEETRAQLLSEVGDGGFALVRRWAPHLSTEEIGMELGSVLDVSEYIPRVSMVQALRPRTQSGENRNQYSGAYGIGRFPLHTDLAHWYFPPRYLLLRCKLGSAHVATTLAPSSILAAALGEHMLRRALLVPRRKSRAQHIYPLPIMFHDNGNWAIRWDSLFLRPLNSAARRVSEIMLSVEWRDAGSAQITLEEAGDTLVIDNWKMFHGRSSVPQDSMERSIERVYLTEIRG